MDTMEEIRQQANSINLKLGKTVDGYKKQLVRAMNNNYDEDQLFAILTSLGQASDASLLIIELLVEDFENNKRFLFSFVNNLGGKTC